MEDVKVCSQADNCINVKFEPHTFALIIDKLSDHGRWDTVVSSIRGLTEIKIIQTFFDKC